MSNGDWGFDWDAEAARRAGDSLDLEATALLDAACDSLMTPVCCVIQMTYLKPLQWLHRRP